MLVIKKAVGKIIDKEIHYSNLTHYELLIEEEDGKTFPLEVKREQFYLHDEGEDVLVTINEEGCNLTKKENEKDSIVETPDDNLSKVKDMNSGVYNYLCALSIKDLIKLVEGYYKLEIKRNNFKYYLFKDGVFQRRIDTPLIESELILNDEFFYFVEKKRRGATK